MALIEAAAPGIHRLNNTTFQNVYAYVDYREHNRMWHEAIKRYWHVRQSIGLGRTNKSTVTAV